MLLLNLVKGCCGGEAAEWVGTTELRACELQCDGYGEAVLSGVVLSHWRSELFGDLLFHLQSLRLVEVSWGEICVVWVPSRIVTRVQEWIMQPWTCVPPDVHPNKISKACESGREAGRRLMAVGKSFPLFGPLFLYAFWLSLCSSLKCSSSLWKQQPELCEFIRIHRPV